MIDLREICKERRWRYGYDESFKAEHMGPSHEDAPFYVEIPCRHGKIYPSSDQLSICVEGHGGIRMRLLRAGFVPVQGDSVFEFGLNQLDEVATIVKPKKLGGRLLTPEEREASAKRLSKYQFQAATADQEPPQSENVDHGIGGDDD